MGLAVLVGLAACGAPSPGPTGDPEALALLERTRAHHGSGVLDQAEMTFSFRGTSFVLRRDGGQFRYARTLVDSAGRAVEEVVDNDGAHRVVDGREVELSVGEAARVATAVNSVAYFALLPAPLADPAVRARLLPPDRVRGVDYDRVEVTFAPEGGGADWEDRYVYWLRQSDGQIGHYAYTYEATPGDTARTATGTRFRAPVATRRVGGVIVQDWRNLTADPLEALERFGELYEAGETFGVSRVTLDSVRVRPL